MQYVMEVRWFVLIVMFFCHIVDDYYLQGILAKMKQKKWWQEVAPQRLYRYDYIVALIMHSISWSFAIMFPLAVYRNFQLAPIFYILFGINIIIHAITDHIKANMLKINLIEDQSIHIIQIVLTFILCT